MEHITNSGSYTDISSIISHNYFEVPLDFASLFTVGSFYVFLLFIWVIFKGKLGSKVLIGTIPVSIILFIPKVLDLSLINSFFNEYDFGAIENRWIGFFIIVSFISTLVLSFKKKPNPSKLFVSLATLCISLGIFVTHITSIQYNIRTNAYLSSEYMRNIVIEEDFDKFVELCTKMNIECMVRDKPIDFEFIASNGSRHIAFEFNKLIDQTEQNNVSLIDNLYQSNRSANIQSYGKGTVSVDFHESQAMAYSKINGLYRLVYSDQNTENVYKLNAWNFFIVIYLIIGFWIVGIWFFEKYHPKQSNSE